MKKFLENIREKFNKLKIYCKDNIYKIYAWTTTIIAIGFIMVIMVYMYNFENAKKFYNYELSSTTAREYELLSTVSREYIDVLNTGEIDVHTDLILDDLIYVDNIDQIADYSNKTNTNEEITYYFDDMIITSHIKDNIMKTNITKFITDTSIKVVVTDIDNIVAVDNSMSLVEQVDMSDVERLVFRIASDIDSLLQGEKPKNNVITDNAKEFIKESISTNIKYINIGKDNIDSTNYNIVFIQLGKGDGSVLNMICKLDSMYKVSSIITL